MALMTRSHCNTGECVQLSSSGTARANTKMPMSANPIMMASASLGVRGMYGASSWKSRVPSVTPWLKRVDSSAAAPRSASSSPALRLPT
eukprot:3939841-Rhodomonas_salina.1